MSSAVALVSPPAIGVSLTAETSTFTVPLALAREVTTVGTEWNIVMAATLVAMLPPLIVYAFSQNKLMGGIASVGIRG